MLFSNRLYVSLSTLYGSFWRTLRIPRDIPLKKMETLMIITMQITIREHNWEKIPLIWSTSGVILAFNITATVHPERKKKFRAKIMIYFCFTFKIYFVGGMSKHLTIKSFYTETSSFCFHQSNSKIHVVFEALNANNAFL